MGFRIGIDVGGTFTDFILGLPDGGIELFKVPTTLDDQSRGVMNGIEQLATRRGLKAHIWDPSFPPPTPIARRRHRFGIPERLDFRGSVVTPLDEGAVRD